MIAPILLTLLIALLLAAVLTLGFGRRMRGWSFWAVLALLFLGGATVAAWVNPVGPVVYGFAWLPVVVGTFLIALLMLTLAAPPGPTRFRTDAELQAEAAAGSWAFLWFLMLALALTAMGAFIR